MTAGELLEVGDSGLVDLELGSKPAERFDLRVAHLAVDHRDDHRGLERSLAKHRRGQSIA